MDRQPLTGIKVIDFSTLLPGPLAGLVLAEAGADVLKVERPGGEEMRHYKPAWQGGGSVNFALLNRGKDSLAVDLKNKKSRAQLEPLLAEADIIIEQFRPGVMARLGLDHDSVKKINPDIIYCSITGYGQTGPKAMAAGHDLNYIGDTGLLALGHGDAKRPHVPPVLAADIAGGTYPAVVNILLALINRDRTGKGAHLDIAMTDNLFMLMSWAYGEGLATGNWPRSGDSLLTGGSPRYQLYPARDGKLLAAAPLEEKFWQTFCDVIDLEAALRKPDAPRHEVIEAVRAIIAQRPSDEWQALFDAADCCCSI
ncbi:MAG TPA: CoA transferase, partial [Rhizobiales bacterium]|nr:CoA transferase [Hyphomicrobiales bacterium]